MADTRRHAAPGKGEASAGTAGSPITAGPLEGEGWGGDTWLKCDTGHHDLNTRGFGGRERRRLRIAGRGESHRDPRNGRTGRDDGARGRGWGVGDRMLAGQ